MNIRGVRGSFGTPHGDFISCGMITLQNEQLEVEIHPRGAELRRICHKGFKLDYLWNGDPAYWGKHAPVLFPIVGQLKENSYRYRGKMYDMSRHGFARELEFRPVAHSGQQAVFELSSSEETLGRYPFLFTLRIIYMLDGNRLTSIYEVTNNGSEPMFFSIGGHPAFRVPLVKGTSYEDYYLLFPQKETAPRWPLQDNLLKTRPEDFLKDQDRIPLRHQLFERDAVVLKKLRSGSISLRSGRTPHGLTMDFTGFPYFGIWAPPEAPFVCLEPWDGIADSMYHNQDLEKKEGILKLEAGQRWEKSWSVVFF